MTAVAFYLATACSGGDDHPGAYDGGQGGSGGSGGTEAGGDAKDGKAGFGGSGGKKDSGPDAPNDQFVDGQGDGDAADAVDASFCSDGTKNFDETDVDCGGAVCPGCDDGKICSDNGDCASKKCNTTSHTCDASLCTDGIQNGNETDVDCGGPNCTKCSDTKSCVNGTDCNSGVCSGNPLTCQAPSCTDQVKNGTEGDIDCGGSCPSKCGLGKACKASADCESDVCTANQCKCPTGMALSQAVGGGSYCIEQYEVTYEQYELFWAANPNFSNSECAWNSGPGKYTPGGNWPAPSGDGKKFPVRNVDWCDAWAYCTWAGKRLCGKQGSGSTPYASFGDETQSQWTNACTAGASTYPYSGSYNPSLCIGSDYPKPDGATWTPPLPGSRTTPPNDCQGAAPGLYDMSGNLAEWEDSCNGTSGASDSCRVRGGSYLQQGAQLACKADKAVARNTQADDIGFRCCFP